MINRITRTAAASKRSISTQTQGRRGGFGLARVVAVAAVSATLGLGISYGFYNNQASNTIAAAQAACAPGNNVASTPRGLFPILHADSAKKSPAAASAAGIKGGIERTFIAVKPDGTQRGLVGKVIERFEARGYKLVAIKGLVPSRELAEVHYGDLKARPFYKGLVDYMTNGKAPVVAMVWEGPDVIRQGRKMIGATNPLDSDPGSIRGMYCITTGRNIIHGSDSFDSANIEIPLWFKPEEVYSWKQGHEEWIMANN